MVLHCAFSEPHFDEPGFNVSSFLLVGATRLLRPALVERSPNCVIILSSYCESVLPYSFSFSFVLLTRWMLIMMKAKLLIKTCRAEGNEKEDRDLHVLLDRKSQCLIQVWKDFCLVSLILLALTICQITALVLFCTIVLVFLLSYYVVRGCLVILFLLAKLSLFECL